MKLDHEDLRAIEACMQTPGWALLREAFAEKTRATITEVFSEATLPEVREMLVARERGRREVLAWFERQLEVGRQLRKVT